MRREQQSTNSVVRSSDDCGTAPLTCMEASLWLPHPATSTEPTTTTRSWVMESRASAMMMVSAGLERSPRFAYFLPRVALHVAWCMQRQLCLHICTLHSCALSKRLNIVKPIHCLVVITPNVDSKFWQRQHRSGGKFICVVNRPISDISRKRYKIYLYWPWNTNRKSHRSNGGHEWFLKIFSYW